MDPVCTTFAFIDGLGGGEMVLIFIVVLVLFGGQKLPEFARGLGKTMREFKKAAAGVEEEFKRALDEDERKRNPPALTAAPPTSSTAAARGDAVAGPSAEDPYASPDEYDSSHEYDYESAAAGATEVKPPVAADETDSKAKSSNEAGGQAPSPAHQPEDVPVPPPAPEQPKTP